MLYNNPLLQKSQVELRQGKLSSIIKIETSTFYTATKKKKIDKNVDQNQVQVKSSLFQPTERVIQCMITFQRTKIANKSTQSLNFSKPDIEIRKTQEEFKLCTKISAQISFQGQNITHNQSSAYKARKSLRESVFGIKKAK